MSFTFIAKHRRVRISEREQAHAYQGLARIRMDFERSVFRYDSPENGDVHARGAEAVQGPWCVAREHRAAGPGSVSGSTGDPVAGPIQLLDPADTRDTRS